MTSSNKDIEAEKLPEHLGRLDAALRLEFEEDLPRRIKAEILRTRAAREAELGERIERSLRAEFTKRLAELIDAKLEGNDT
jgi:hypothetical protein